MDFAHELNEPTVQELIDILQKVPDKKVKVLIEHNDHTDWTYKLAPDSVYKGNPNDDGTDDPVDEDVIIIHFGFGD